MVAVAVVPQHGDKKRPKDGPERSSTYYRRKAAGVCVVCGGARDRVGIICSECARIKSVSKRVALDRKKPKSPLTLRELLHYPRRGLLESPTPPRERPTHIWGKRDDGLGHLRGPHEG